MEQNNGLLVTFFDEIKTLSKAVKISSYSQVQQALRLLTAANSNAVLLNVREMEKVTFALKSLFSSLNDQKIQLNENLLNFLSVTSDKLLEISAFLQSGNSYDEESLKNFILYCDRIAAGEIIDQKPSQTETSVKENPYSDDEGEILVKRSKIKFLSNQINEIFTSQQRLKNQFESIFRIGENSDNIEIKKISQQVQYSLSSINTLLNETKDELSRLSMYPLQAVFNNVKDSIEKQPLLRQSREVTVGISQTAIVLEKQLLPLVEEIISLCIKAEACSDETVSKIKIDSSLDGETISVSVTDDGAGFDEETLRQKLIAAFPQKVKEIGELQKGELFNMMFLEDFSRELNHIWNLVEKIKGHIKIFSEKGKGCSMIFCFPDTLSDIHGFFITSNRQKFFITSHHVIDTARNSAEVLHSVQNQYYYNYRGREIPVYSLKSLINQGETTGDSSSGTIIFTEYLNQNTGIIVEDISVCVSLQKKDLPPAFENQSVLQGLVYDDRHDLIPILSVPEIMKKLVSLRSYDYKKFDVFSKKPVFRILIADDSEISRQIEKAALKSDDFYIEEAEDGIVAIEKLKQAKFDLIITDTSMPRMNGDILVENMKRMETYKNTPVIVIQPSTDKEEQASYQKLGVNAFMSKNDFKRQEFIKLVKELIND